LLFLTRSGTLPPSRLKELPMVFAFTPLMRPLQVNSAEHSVFKFTQLKAASARCFGFFSLFGPVSNSFVILLAAFLGTARPSVAEGAGRLLAPACRVFFASRQERSQKPTAGGYAIGLLARDPAGNLILGLAPYLTGRHGEIKLQAEARFGPGLTILWAGEVSLSAPFQVGSANSVAASSAGPDITEINETSGYMNTERKIREEAGIPSTEVSVGQALRLLSAMSSSLVDDGARPVPFDSRSQHLFPPLNRLIPEMPPEGTARHFMANKVNTVFLALATVGALMARIDGETDLSAVSAGIKKANGMLQKILGRASTTKSLRIFAKMLSLEGFDSASLLRILDRWDKGFLVAEDLRQIAKDADAAVEFWNKARERDRARENIRFIVTERQDLPF
jgi:hypothetical protein